jgi:hypothetical protein
MEWQPSALAVPARTRRTGARGGGGAVYIRPSVVREAGKSYRYERLVRAMRRNGKVVQETVARLPHLGDDWVLPRFVLP